MLTSIKSIIENTKLCPHRIGFVDHPLCAGATCMAWRWAGYATSTGTIAARPPQDARLTDRLGYCGLAGVPELRPVNVEQ